MKYPVLAIALLLCPMACGSQSARAVRVVASGPEVVNNVKSFGAVCDGIHRTPDDTAAIQAAADASFGSAAAPHAAHYDHNIPLYFPPGHCIIHAPILFTYVQGAHIFGAGRFTSEIENIAGTGVFKTNGFEYGVVERLFLRDDGAQAPVIDLNWDGKTIALQSNSFRDLYVSGGRIGVRIGAGDFMGSENMFLNDYITNASEVGLETDNYNALQNTIVGGNIGECPIGVKMNKGTVSVYNTGFQGQTLFDVVQLNTANDAIVLSGSRSESVNFFSGGNGMVVKIVGVSQTNSKPGIFAQGSVVLSIDSVRSLAGQVVPGKVSGSITNSSFGRKDWIKPPTSPSNLEIDAVTYNTADSPIFIQRKLYYGEGQGQAFPSWATTTVPLAIPAGNGVAVWSIPEHARIVSVGLILDTPGSAGTVTVGDGSNATRYFASASLTSGGGASATTNRYYPQPDRLIVSSRGAKGAVGSVAVTYMLLN